MAAALRAEIDDPTIELYFRGLQDIPFELVMDAGERLLVSARFFPKIAEWRQSVDAVLNDRQNERRKLLGRQQQLLPGDVGAGRCPTCDDTGFRFEDRACTLRTMTCPAGEHTHRWSVKCETCLEKRRKRAEENKRYSRLPYSEED